MPAEPHTPPGTMAPTEAAHVAGRARKLLRAGRISHHDYAVLDALLWSARRPGSDRAVIAYSRLQSLANVARATVAKAIGRLVDLGLVRRIRHRALAVWHNGGRAWRQLPNEYRFHREFTPRPEAKDEITHIYLMTPSVAAARDAEEALAARRRAVEATWLGKTGGVS